MKDKIQGKTDEQNLVGATTDTNETAATKSPKDKSTNGVTRSIDDTLPEGNVDSKGAGHEDDVGEEMDENQEDTVIY